MIESIDTILHKMRFLFVGLLVIASLLLLTVFATGMATALSHSPAPTIEASSKNKYETSYSSNDANAVTGGMSDFAAQVGAMTVTTGRALNGGVQSVAAATSQSAQFVGRGIGRLAAGSARLAVYGVSSSVGFVARTTGTIVGLFTNAPVVSSVVKPSNDSNTPVIGPVSASSLAAQTPLSPVSSPQANQSSDSVAAWPIHGEITTFFGVPHWPYQPTHTGIDISDGLPSGVTQIKPYKSGKVIEVVRSNAGLGNHVVVDHGAGVTSVYGHMYATSVEVGQIVEKTTTLGLEGSTGASTGTHLHFEIRLNGVSVDPLQYVNGRP